MRKSNSRRTSFAALTKAKGRTAVASAVQMDHLERRICLTADVTEFVSPVTGLGLKGIAMDNNGNLWFAEPGVDMNPGRIGELLTHDEGPFHSGTFFQFSIPVSANKPQYIALGSDGNMWFTESPGNAIARITPAGVVTEFPLPSPNAQPNHIIGASDGNLWFTESGTDVNKIAKSTTTGTVTEFSTLFAPPPPDQPWGLVDRLDGNIWYVANGSSRVGRISYNGSTAAETSIPTASSGPWGIATSPDDLLYYTESATDKIGRISDVFSPQSEITLPAGSQPHDIVRAPDGYLYFTEFGRGRVAQLDPFSFSVVREYIPPTPFNGADGIVIGPDGNPWITEPGFVTSIDRIGRVNVHPDEENLKAALTPQTAGQAFNGTVATFTSSMDTSVAGDFAANIDWGDGSLPTVGTITKGAGGLFTVTGSHTYANGTGSPYHMSVTISRSDTTYPLNVGADVTVNDPNAPPPVPPSISIGDVTQSEGNSGTTNFNFIVTRSGDLTGTSTVAYSTSDGSATVADSDYQAAANTITFNPGDTTKTITVQVNGDTNVEPNETFFVNLSSPSNASLSNSTATGTISNDDSAPPPPPPAISIADVSHSEGNSGTTAFHFTVTRSGDLSGTSTVAYSTADGTATAADNDYQPASNTVAFGPGEFSKTITVLVNGDTKGEADETFSVNLSSPVGATLGTSSATGTILNDDPIEAPFSGSVPPLVGKHEGEDFDLGGEGVAYHDTDPANDGGKYRTTEAVDIENTTDSGGGFDVGWAHAGEYLKYTLQSPGSASYPLTLRVANVGAGGKLHVEVDGTPVTGSLAVPNTGNFQAYTTINAGNIPISAGTHVIKIVWDANAATGFSGNLNYFTFAAPPPPPPANTPFGGTAAPVPGIIQAENYDVGGEGVAFHDTTAANEGGKYRTAPGDSVDVESGGSGFDVGWTHAGEWLKYSVNVATTGAYTFDARVANVGGGATFHVEVDGVNVTGTLAVTNTGSFTTYADVTKAGISLTAGTHVIRIVWDSNTAFGFAGNLDFFKFT